MSSVINNQESVKNPIQVIAGNLTTPEMARHQKIYTQIPDTTEKAYSEDLGKQTEIIITVNDAETSTVSETKTTERQKVSECIAMYTTPVTKATKAIFAALFLAYVGYSMTVEFGSENSLRLLIGTILGFLLISWNLIKKWKWFANIYDDLRQMKCQSRTQLKIRKYIRWGLYIAMLVVVGSLVGTTVAKGNFRNLVSFGGLLVFLLLLYATSLDRSNISWHSVFWGFGIQFTLAILVLYTSGGKDAVVWCSKRLSELLQHSSKGSEFVFGKNYMQFYFAFGLLPQIMFFVAMVRILTHLGVLSFVNRNLGSFLAFCTGTSNPESICAAANVFVGGGQAILFIRQYLDFLTEPEIFCVFVGDLASIGGGAVVLYSGYGIPVQYLISASVLSAPAALAAAKLNYPSSPSLPKTNKSVEKKENALRTESNVLHALSVGSAQGLAFVASIAANVMVLLSMLNLVDTALEWFGARAGFDHLNFETISSYLFYPFAFLMGVDVGDCSRVSNLLGLRSMIDLTVAYIRMGEYFTNKEAFNEYSSLYNDTVFYQDSHDIYLPQWNQTLDKGILSDRSEVISAYALCGFASLSSLGISIGSISVLAPKFIGAVTKFAPRAIIVATLACYFTACVAGMLYQGD